MHRSDHSWASARLINRFGVLVSTRLRASRSAFEIRLSFDLGREADRRFPKSRMRCRGANFRGRVLVVEE